MVERILPTFEVAAEFEGLAFVGLRGGVEGKACESVEPSFVYGANDGARAEDIPVGCGVVSAVGEEKAFLVVVEVGLEVGGLGVGFADCAAGAADVAVMILDVIVRTI